METARNVLKTNGNRGGLFQRLEKFPVAFHAAGQFFHADTDEREVKILFEILEKRCEINLSTIICSQREPASWSSMILNDEVSANAILKRATKHYTVVIKPRMAV